MASRILRRPEVENRTGLKRSTLYDLMAAGRFPRPIKIGFKAVGWTEETIEQWIKDRVEAASAA